MPETAIPSTMTALRVHGPGRGLSQDEVPVPVPNDEQVLLEVLACGVCRTDLHVLDAELPDLRYPVTPGHEIVGRVVRLGAAVTGVRLGDRVGVPWLAHTCGACRYCALGLENLCEHAEFTGYTVAGGYAEFAVADARYCLPLPPRYTDVRRAAVVRRIDRLSRLSRGRPCAAARSVRLRRGCSLARPSGACGGAAGVCVHEARRRGGAGIRAPPRRSVGRRLR
jgi:NADPH:quinone reductase-like Zn-dependent oxidoreductase